LDDLAVANGLSVVATVSFSGVPGILPILEKGFGAADCFIGLPLAESAFSLLALRKGFEDGSVDDVPPEDKLPPPKGLEDELEPNKADPPPPPPMETAAGANLLALSPVKSFLDPRADPAEAAADSDEDISVAGLLVPTPLEPLEPKLDNFEARRMPLDFAAASVVLLDDI